jgi:cyclophilin family peptidyl-prolyl cis-trans isomerase
VLREISIATIQDELPNKHSNVRGLVTMAKTSEPNSANSQFYINLKDNSLNLDSNYSVFGTVIAGMDVVDAIGRVATDPSNDKPLRDITLTKAEFAP